MGLFSFIKNAGSKLFGKTPTPAAEERAATTERPVDDAQRELDLESMVNSLGLEIANLNVEVDGDRATVYGTANSFSNKEKTIIAVGNVEGIGSVDDQMEVVFPEEVERAIAEPESQMYTVQAGDTLSKIAKEFYGNANKYHEIFEANRPMLSHPDKIYVGQGLRIPANV